MKIPAILGGKPEITKPFPKYNTIGKDGSRPSNNMF